MSATTPVSTRPVQSAASPWRSVGLWMSALLITYLIAITGIVLLTWFLTRRWVRRASAAGPDLHSGERPLPSGRGPIAVQGARPCICIR